MQGAMVISILVRIQVTPRWVNDPVWIHNGKNGREDQGRRGYPPPRRKSGVGQIMVERVKKNSLRNN